MDVYLHGRYEQSGGFNVWGYRGRPAGKKQAGEFRIVVLGGSAAYGYGVSADEAMPAVLERLLRSRVQSPVFTVINLAYNNEGAYSFKTTLTDYRWLDYDLAFLYEGYNDPAERYARMSRCSGTTRRCSGSPATCRSFRSSSRKNPPRC